MGSILVLSVTMLFTFAVVAGLSGAFTRRRASCGADVAARLGRAALAAVLLLAAAFCAFGFLATGELGPGPHVFHFVYGGAGLLSTAGAGWLLGYKPHATRA